VGKTWKPNKPTVELAAEARPSRIRREPPPPVKEKTVRAYPTERETWIVATGVVLFGLALMIIWFGVSDFTSR
jgi:hypothetical protein